MVTLSSESRRLAGAAIAAAGDCRVEGGSLTGPAAYQSTERRTPAWRPRQSPWVVSKGTGPLT